MKYRFLQLVSNGYARKAKAYNKQAFHLNITHRCLILEWSLLMMTGLQTL